MVVLGLRTVLSFVKVEHTLFSLPFILIGAIYGQVELVRNGLGSGYLPRVLDVVLILIAAVGARGLAMTLNRIIDRDIDAANPRTADRHLPSGSMSMQTAYALATMFLVLLVGATYLLNTIALSMVWLPVAAFVIYPYMKRWTWACHLWLGFCLGLAPAGAWLGVVGDEMGYAAITELHWHPGVLYMSLGVLFWIASFDFVYSMMDIESDEREGIHSISSRFGVFTAVRGHWIAVLLSIALLYLSVSNLPDTGDGWFANAGVLGWFGFTAMMAFPVLFTFMGPKSQTLRERIESGFEKLDMAREIQEPLFKSYAASGWVLLLGIACKMVFSG